MWQYNQSDLKPKPPQIYFKLWTKYYGKAKSEESMFQQRWMCVCIFADTVDCGIVWMKGNIFMVFEEWGPTPATLGSCYPPLCLCSWGDFNEYSCSSLLLAPVRLHTGLPPTPTPLLPDCACLYGPSTARMKRRWRQRGGPVIELNNWCVEFTREHLKSFSEHTLTTICWTCAKMANWLKLLSSR